MCEVVRFRRCCGRFSVQDCCPIVVYHLSQADTERGWGESGGMRWHLSGAWESSSHCVVVKLLLALRVPLLLDSILKNHIDLAWQGIESYPCSTSLGLDATSLRRRIAVADKMRERRRRSSASSAALRDGRNLKCKICLFLRSVGI